MSRPLRVALVGPVAHKLEPYPKASIELITWLLAEGLVQRGLDVTLFAPGGTRTSAHLHATFPTGYSENREMWPWDLYEMLNLAAAIEHEADFDVIHSQAQYYPVALPFARLTRTPLLQTLHHAPSASEVDLWKRYRDVKFVAISREQQRRLDGTNIVATILHGIDVNAFTFRAEPDDYLLFLGRFTEGKGVLQAIEVARDAGVRLLMAAARTSYYETDIEPLVDGDRIVYVGEVGHEDKVRLLGGARALLYPLQQPEPFGLVLAESMATGTPVAALDCGAAREIVDDGVTGLVFSTLDEMKNGLAELFSLDRAKVRCRAVERFRAERMVDEHIALYHRLAS